MSKLKNYLSLIKFSHTIFAMPFALIGFLLGVLYHNMNSMHTFNIDPVNFQTFKFYKLLLLVILCMIFARSAAMAFNRYLDRNIDALNPRTAIREVPTGIISANNALIFTIISCALFLVTCAFINKP